MAWCGTMDRSTASSLPGSSPAAVEVATHEATPNYFTMDPRGSKNPIEAEWMSSRPSTRRREIHQRWRAGVDQPFRDNPYQRGDPTDVYGKRKRHIDGCIPALDQQL